MIGAVRAVLPARTLCYANAENCRSAGRYLAALRRVFPASAECEEQIDLVAGQLAVCQRDGLLDADQRARRIEHRQVAGPPEVEQLLALARGLRSLLARPLEDRPALEVAGIGLECALGLFQGIEHGTIEPGDRRLLFRLGDVDARVGAGAIRELPRDQRPERKLERVGVQEVLRETDRSDRRA